MSAESANGAERRRTLLPISVFRVKPGIKVNCWTLAASVPGCWTLWQRGGSRYIDPNDAEQHRANPDLVWKGYLPAMIFVQRSDHWEPVLLEVTEKLELDFRHVLARGQVWTVWREPNDPPQRGRKPKVKPVRGRLLEESRRLQPPAAFDPVPILRTFYHVDGLLLNVENPQPDLTYMEPIAGEAPQGTCAPRQAAPPPSQEEIANRPKFTERFYGRNGRGIVLPAPTKGE